MSTELSNKDDEIIIDLNKIIKIIWYRKIPILACFAIIISLSLLMAYILPKTYTSEARLMINDANPTNLADINPFLISKAAGSGGGLSFLTKGSNLSNEIELIKSPLVLDAVIKNNDLKYSKGIKKGEYLAADSLLKKNLIIETLRDTNIITITYKSANPERTYKVIKSIIDRYEEINEEINLSKSEKDIKFLEKAYLSAKIDLEKKINIFKQRGLESNTASTQISSAQYNLLGLYDKRISKSLDKISDSNVDVKKLQMEIEQEAKKVEMLKTKYEWSLLIENLSKNATKITVLKKPDLRKKEEFSSPKPIINLAIAVVLSILISSILLFFLESKDKKLTYSDLGGNYSLIKGKKIDTSDLKVDLYHNKTNKIGLINLVNLDLYKEVLKLFENTNMNFTFSNGNNFIEDHIKTITEADKLIILAKMGKIDRKLYKNIKDLCNKMNKNILIEYILV